MKQVCEAIFLKKLRILLSKRRFQITGIDAGNAIKQAGCKCWNVYAKAPYGNVASVVEYPGRYTHKVAIAKQRIVDITGDAITFNYKDYGDGNRQKEMTPGNAEFLRRFEIHFLPMRFVKIRHGGYLAHNDKNIRVAAIHQQLNLPRPMPKVIMPFNLQMLQRTGTDYSVCPKCREGKIEIVASYLNHNGTLVNIKDLQKLKNKASPCVASYG